MSDVQLQRYPEGDFGISYLDRSYNIDMRQVPYHGNPDNACALACYTMAAQYLLPAENITLEQLGKIADWKKGYVVWAYPVWKWLMDKGIRITDIDVIDNELWAKEGIKGLRKSVSSKEFQFYKDNTFDLDMVSEQLAMVYDHPNFTYIRKRLSWEDVVTQFNEPGICDITVDGRKLHRKEGFTMHRVVLIDITDKEVVFHDPNDDSSGAYAHEPIDFFRSCFESLDGPEMAQYSLT